MVPARRHQDTILLSLYAITLFGSAALLFAVQPMFGKMVLPVLGGTSAVWITCMCFFQTVLLAGYAYAHATTSWLGVRRQAVVHVLVLLGALAVQPIAVRYLGSPPTGTTPVFWLLLVLAVSVGGPFFAVATAGPLMQKWFAHTAHPARDDPYFLYTASNLGSMLALLAYPVLIEPTLRLQAQSWLWTYAYAVVVVLTLGCAVSVWRCRGEPAEGAQTPAGGASRPSAAGHRLSSDVTTRRRLLWVLFSFVPSSAMLGVTSYLTSDVAPMPLLWIIPLATYLLTFILAFARKPLIPPALPLRVFPYAVLLLVVSFAFFGTWQALLLHLVVFFLVAFVFHGALAHDRPAPVHLTEFYLWIAIGGALGGVFNALVAPLAFPWGLEYPATMLLACLFYPDALRKHGLGAPERWVNVALLTALALMVALFVRTMGFSQSPTLILMVLYGTPLLVLLCAVKAYRWFAVGIAVLLFAEKLEPPFAGSVVYTARSFFGVHRVMVDAKQRHRYLLHGRTVHGLQSRDPQRQCEPLAYYHRAGPLGQVFGEFRGENAKQRVALVGLGVGTMICYRQFGQEFTFYEIDPTVKRIAETSEWFSYLSACGSDGYRIVLGDGRLKLAEAPDHCYGMIIFDAFSSDAIPTHLLTRQALAIYLDKLVDDGILVFHTSNLHLDLEPVLANLAADARLVGRICRDDYASKEDFEAGKYPSTYVVLARDRFHLRGLAQHPRWHPLAPGSPDSAWTDDFSNIISIIKWW